MPGSILPTLEILKKAQALDLRIYEAQSYFDDLPAERVKIRADLEKELHHLKELEESQKKLQLLRKEKEGLLGEKEYQIKKLDGQLSQVKTNKEYGAIQQEIASLKADNSILEEEIIRILDDIEAAAAAVKNEQVRVHEIEKESQKKENELKDKETKFLADHEKLKTEREEVLQAVPPDVRDLYERIIRKNHGRALVSAKGGVCAACQMKLRAQVLNEVMMGDTLVLCDCSSYILYLDE